MGGWWHGTRLVAERSLTENLRSKTVRIVTAALLVLSLVAVIAPNFIGQGETTYTLATVGEISPAVKTAIDEAAAVAEIEVDYAEHPDETALRRALEDGEADAGVTDDTIYTVADLDAAFTVLVTQAVVSSAIQDRLAGAGLQPEQIVEVLSVRAPERVVVGGETDTDRLGIAFIVGVVLYLAVTFAGSAIATAVATEKSTNISEVLLAILRPTQVMVGTVMAIGVIAVGQLLVLAAPILVAINVSDSLDLPAAAAGDIALGVVWFVLGFFLYSFVFAAAGALVNKLSEASATTMPIQLVLITGYMFGIIGARENPDGPASVILSLVPPTAPLVMPVRWASGEVPVWQLALAMGLTAAAALLLAKLASTAYQRALLITGRRAKLREVLSPTAAPRAR